MSKIKVAFFADCLIENYDGAIRTMYQLIDRIDTDVYEFLFITGDKPQLAFDHQILEVPSLKIPFNNNYKMSLPFLVRNRIYKALDKFAPDVIHLASPSPLGYTGLDYANIFRIPTISIYHTHYVSYTDYYMKQFPLLLEPAKKFVQSITQKFYNRCDQVYVPTKQMINELIEIGVFSDHLEIWKRGIDTSKFDAKKKDTAYIQKVTGNENKNLLFASRLVWEKNLETLIRIYKEIKSRGLEYNLIIAGEGHAKNKLQQEMPDAVFMGHMNQDELGKLYASSDLFLFPSISESYGNVVAEAMVSGLPCVIGNGGGTTEFVDHGENGFLCSPNDEKEYVNRIEELFSNDQLRKQFIQKGVGQFDSMSWDALADKYFRDVDHLSHKLMLRRA